MPPFVLYAHVADVTVAAGDRVSAGQPVARLGNNGISRLPHIHIDAYRGATALQVRWDLRAMGRVREPVVGWKRPTSARTYY